MRTIINYIRQIFCKHDFIVNEGYCESNNDITGWVCKGTKVYMRCKKCGWHTSHWKF